MALTRINNEQISNAISGNASAGINASQKIQDRSVTSAQLANSISLSGNITAGNVLSDSYYYANGAPFVSYSDADVTALLNTGLSGNLIPAANNVYSIGNLTNQWSSVYVSASTIYFDGVPMTGNVSTLFYDGLPLVSSSADGNISTGGNVAAGNVVTDGDVVAAGNVVADGYFFADGSPLTQYTDADVSTYLASGTNTANITTTANISGAYIIGDGSELTNLAGASVVGAVALATQATQADTANVALVAESIPGANVSGAVALATQADTANVALVAESISGANVSGAVALATQADTANVALVANLVDGANVSGAVALATQAVQSDTANVALQADSANSVAGANVSGAVALATQSDTANIALVSYSVDGANVFGAVALATQADTANVAYSVNGANVFGAVALATQADTANVALQADSANSVAGANVSGAVALATQADTANVSLVANSVAGVNVSGAVALATQADTANVSLVANSVAGANVSGAVALATQAVQSDIANVALQADSANSVAGANVSGAVALATQADTANVALVAESIPGANVVGNVSGAIVAGTVTTAAQPNITSVGTLNSLTVTGNVNAANFNGTFHGVGTGLSALTGANVTGTVANAVYALNAGNATVANTALLVNGANVVGEVALANTVSNPLQPNITSVGTLTSLTANAATINGTFAATGNATFGNAYFGGNVNIAGNITQVSGNSGQFFGNAITGFGALYAGLPAGYTLLNQEVMQYATSFNGYTQVSIQNINPGNQATGDLVITADNGNDTTNYLDLGMASSGYDGALANNSLGTSVFANDGYLYAKGDVGGGNLVLGSKQPGSSVRIVTGDTNIGDVVATFNTTGLDVNGNVTADYFIGDGSRLTNIYGNANVAAYLPTYTGNVGLGNLVFSPTQVQTIAYAGGVGRQVMIDTSRTDTYVATGSSDKPFKTFAAAVAAVAAANPTGTVPCSFVLMSCNISETVDLTANNFNFITITTEGRSVFNGPVTIGNSALKQLVVRDVEFANTFTVTGDGTANQLNNTSFYDVAFSGPVVITAATSVAFTQAAFFAAVTFNNVNYTYINGAQFNADWTIRADNTGAFPIPALGVAPAIMVLFDFIANNVIFVKGGTAACVFQPHAARLGRTTESYTLPAGWTVAAYSTVFRGTWTNSGTWSMRNSSNDNPIAGTAPTYSGTIGGTLVTASGNITSGGNVSANFYIGNGSLLTNITGANVTGTVANAANAAYALNANSSSFANTAFSVDGANVVGNVSSAIVAGTVTTNAQPNITSVGTLTSLDVTGNVTAGGIVTTGSSGNITGVFALVAAYLHGDGSNITNVTATSVAANALTGNTLSANVLNSSLTRLGTLESLAVSGITDLVDLNASGQVVLNGVTITESQLTTTASTLFEILGTDQGVQLQSLDTANSTFTLVFADNTGVGLVTDAGEIVVGLDGNVTVTDSMSIGGELSTVGNITGANIVADYLYGDGSNITGIPAPVAEASFTIESANFTVVEGSRYGVNTAGGAVTATLPSAPTTGAAVFFADAGGAFATNNLTIDPDGGEINGIADVMTVNTNNQSFGLFYNGTTWRTY